MKVGNREVGELVSAVDSTTLKGSKPIRMSKPQALTL